MHFIPLLRVFSSYILHHTSSQTIIYAKCSTQLFPQTAPRVTPEVHWVNFDDGKISPALIHMWQFYSNKIRFPLFCYLPGPFLASVCGLPLKPRGLPWTNKLGNTDIFLHSRGPVVYFPHKHKISQFFPVNAYQSTTTIFFNNFQFIINKSSHYSTLYNLRYWNDLTQTINKRKIKYSSKLLTS
jgi:hypothetical protein